MTEGGKVSMPLIDVWMTKEEIADMFGLPEALIFRTIRSIYKKSELYEHETANRIPFPKKESKGWTMEVYNLDSIIYLTYVRLHRLHVLNHRSLGLCPILLTLGKTNITVCSALAYSQPS